MTHNQTITKPSVLHNAGYWTDFRFSGKELDNETDMYYYGARYYAPGILTWYSADPLAETYPFMSPYAFCNGNPVRYVERDGRETSPAVYYETSRSWGLRLGDYLRDATGWHSEIELQQKMAETVLPMIQGGMLLIPYVGIANDIYTLRTGRDIYGNVATEFDYALCKADIVTFGLAKKLKVGTFLQETSDFLNKTTSASSIFNTIHQGYHNP